jgi:hypothetical protein
MAKTGGGNDENENGKTGGIREGQIIDVRKGYCDVGSAMVGNGADRAIVVVILIVIVVMECDQQHRVQHYHRHCEGDAMPKAFFK